MVFEACWLSIELIIACGSTRQTHALCSKGNVLRHIPQCPMVQGRVAPLGSGCQLPVASGRRDGILPNTPSHWVLATGGCICPGARFVLCFDEEVRTSVADPQEQERPDKPRKSRWLWPAGAMATGLAGVALLLLRGCWHRKMSWPVRAEGHAYQVCLGCGVKRLFDETRFRSYGPFHYDLDELIAWETARETEPAAPEEQRPAS